LEQGEAYARATGYPIQYQWTLLEGINDTKEELTGIARLRDSAGQDIDGGCGQLRARMVAG
jgi:23S rRNA (adenine2503-C2)-methyltransferase